MKKLTLTIVSILSVVAIFGVGFAAWVIINPTVNGTADGTITVETVTDKSYTLTATVTGDIVFGAPAAAKTDANKWLKADSSAAEENLTSTVVLTFTYTDEAVLPEKLTLSLASSNSTNFGQATGANYISGTVAVKKEGTALGHVTVDGDSSTLAIATAMSDLTKGTDTAEGKHTASVTVTLTFAWGTAFNSENPYTFYNAKGYSATEAANANTALTALYNALNGVKYTLTVQGTTKAAA